MILFCSACLPSYLAAMAQTFQPMRADSRTGFLDLGPDPDQYFWDSDYAQLSIKQLDKQTDGITVKSCPESEKVQVIHAIFLSLSLFFFALPLSSSLLFSLSFMAF